MSSRFNRIFPALLLTLALAVLSFAADTGKRTPPATRRDNVSETVNGTAITDPYRWLEDQNSPETRAWIDAQNQYTKSFLENLPTRAEISRRLGELIKVDTMSARTERGGRYFYTERKADQDLSVIHVRQGLDGKDEVLIDPHPMSADHTTSVTTLGIRNDGKVLMYGVRLGGADEVEVRGFDVDQKKDTADKLERGRYSGVAITPDGSGIYYGILTAEGPRVRYHAVGTDTKLDKQIFGDGYGREAIISPSLSEDGRWLMIDVAHGASSDFTEVYLQDLTAKTPIQPLVNDVHARFDAHFAGDKLFIETNWNAPNGRVLAVELAHPQRENWKDVIKEGDSPIEGLSAVGGKLFVRYLHNATSQVQIFSPEGKNVGTIALPTLGTVNGISGRWTSKDAFYGFSSFVTPSVIKRYEVATGKQSEWFRTKAAVDPSKFEVQQVWYESKDKTKIPMFLVYAKGLKKDGARPTLLTGYGGFNLNRTPGFTAEAVIFAEHGGIYALPNLRGGGEFGEKWHRAGMLANKQNVFDDFESAGEWLVKNGYTSSSKLAISGGSNGGLLVGAALTQRPDLFRAVVCSYPLLDMVRYQKFFVARYWVSEYGSSEDPQQFEYILKYSPYQNVKQGTKYPAVLFVSGDSDTRVAPLHARKMAALLQASQGGDNPILLHYDTKAGHSGGRSISKVIEDQTDEYSFLFWQLGVQSSEAKTAGK
jgi:prolyl oligopeptidase